jgi:non-specific serine/threonine protein kinase
MLETIREYGLARLAETGEEDTFRAHAQEFADVAETAYDLRNQAEAEWSSRLDRDHDDLRAALDLSKTNPDAALTRRRARLVLVHARIPRRVTRG